ncbi:MAG: InlB B-repeat-containing protein [Lachnospiraceae bacterium]|nr:InlB B-repeat-containing protein [Lachnospiraceae bacterium]
MRKHFKRLLSLLLTFVMILGLSGITANAAGNKADARIDGAHVYTEAENALLENDVFASISSLRSDAAQAAGGLSRLTEADYIRMVPDVISAIKSSATYVEGSLQQNGNFLVWQTTTGIPCCYDPRMEAKLHGASAPISDEELMAIDRETKELEARLGSLTADLNGGAPSSVEIGLIQPYWESNSSYADSSFRSYSPYYKSMWQSLYQATGGSSSYRYSMTNATVDNVAKAIANCAIVIMDSHGTTDYSGSNEDYTSRANSSYLCLTTNSGVTSTDTAAKTGTYGTYYDALKGSGYAYVNGNCIANHMTKNAPHSLVYMGICLGMATDKMFTGLRNKGVEVVYGYSQSVSFVGERQYMESILGYVKNGDTFASALSKAKSSLGSWDPAYSSYSLSQAKSNKVAFPIAVSSEDSYPGQGKVDAVQTVYSAWQLFGGSTTSYTVTASSNNTSWGTVSVSGNTITASPKTGYQVSGYQVTSGSATVTQNGNTFTVNPTSNCNVQINFAAKTSYTVTYKANGSTYGTASAYAGDSVTLPSTATAVSGWSFLGWAASQVAETTSQPSYYAPGASFTPSGNTTLYALYTKSEGGSGETVYELLTQAPSNWAGNYVITYGNGSSLYALKGLSSGTKYESASSGGAVALSSTGMTLSGSQLKNASNAYIFKVASYNSKYSIQNASTGSYLASRSNYLYAYTLNSSYYTWGLQMSGSAVSASNSAASRYPYLAFSSSKYFMINSSTSGIYFWKEASAGTSYYATSPQTQTHEHSYGAWTSNDNGTHSRSCSCGDKETKNCTYMSVVTAPTATEQGYTTYTCTVCGYSYVGDYTPATGTSYTVSFLVPSGVAAVASVTCNSNSSFTLPTAGALSGYTFLGWVTGSLSATTSRPSTILTGTYKPTGNITLYALYSYTQSGGSTGYELLTSAPSDWSGQYVITYGNGSSLYALKGLSNNKKYESSSAGGAVALSSTGMTLSGSTLTNVGSAYTFTITKSGSKYSIKNNSTGTYLSSRSSYLYALSSLSSSYGYWTFAMNGSAVRATNSYSSRYPYLAFSSSKYFMINSSTSGIYFWKLSSTVGSTTYYTTGN